MKHDQHPSGDQHWTKRTPDRILRGPAAPGAKLTQDEIELLCSAYYDLSVKPSQLAKLFGVSRITVWRHLRARAILDQGGVPRETPPTQESASASV